MSISKTDELLGYIDLCNTVSELDKDDPTVKKIGLDLTKIVEKATTDTTNPGPATIRNLYLGSTVTFTVQFSAALKDTQHVFLAGGMNGWTGKEMTKGENNTYSIEIEGLMPGEYEFKVVVVDIAADAEVKFDWGGVNFGVDDGKGNIGNAKVTVAASDAIPGPAVTLPLFADALVMPTTDAGTGTDTPGTDAQA